MYKQVSNMVSTSVLAYANGFTSMGTGTTAMQDLAKASYMYWQKADAYFSERG